MMRDHTTAQAGEQLSGERDRQVLPPPLSPGDGLQSFTGRLAACHWAAAPPKPPELQALYTDRTLP